MANELQLQFEKLSNLAHSVKMIIEKQLVVSNRKKADIMADLRKLKFCPFLKVTKPKQRAKLRMLFLLTRMRKR